MVDITHKSSTLRKAIAEATVNVSSENTIRLIEQRQIPKGDIFEFARASALLAIKKTGDMIPDCHPLPVEYAAIRYSIMGLQIRIEVEVHTIYKTGVEVEAMHGASVAALVIYDMLKPVDKQVEIGAIRLLEKRGGKSNESFPWAGQLRAAVVVCSDTVAAGHKQDVSGKLLFELLEKQGLRDIAYAVVADEPAAIRERVEHYQQAGIDLLVFTGGTGLSDRDVTPDTVAPYITRDIPGIMETARQYGQQRVKTAMLSRGISGFADRMLILTLPGSPNGVRESIAALFPQLLHVFQVRENTGH
ncbi:bifunctional molybdenum cofactor biosynthesis protein MoaC/MoaB [Sphingobacterium sp. CZ-UAM]|uniref:bifunctional molybdenum cofactor biosynthesis protein MoaC/MoaB n=1 Tax=Sphingobacterium sp. CZ-UAM TaxID=1933868 RepID=UPI000986ADD7|nr:bifunctional molybdenum cofactor biosynthesis protein MoaC/MoaB [Sphingobacterium sp. CZ-UAM]OOG19194.1 bifunctional molybdenum cofactor biosynthesis protein MoaC/MoaB [Sphingobacterium sp. CZ-UAM]